MTELHLLCTATVYMTELHCILFKAGVYMIVTFCCSEGVGCIKQFHVTHGVYMTELHVVTNNILMYI